MRSLVTATAVAAALAAPAMAQETMRATATMMSAEGETVGTIELSENENGVLIHGEFEGLPPGWHAFHIHQTGSCEDDFQAAGDHYNPTDKEHGVLNPAGAHAGDLPNLWVAVDGIAGHDVITTDVTLAEGAEATLFDDDGSSFIIHENPDSYQADAGAGGRIACGVIEPAA